MNFYKLARENNEVIDFFRGNGKYFDSNRERGGSHDFSFTSYHLFGYAKQVGETNFFNLLNDDLIKYVHEKDFDIDDLSIVIKLIWMYNYFRKEDGRLKKDWEMDIHLVESINDSIENKLNINSKSKICELINELYTRFNYCHIIKCCK